MSCGLHSFMREWRPAKSALLLMLRVMMVSMEATASQSSLGRGSLRDVLQRRRLHWELLCRLCCATSRPRQSGLAAAAVVGIPGRGSQKLAPVPEGGSEGIGKTEWKGLTTVGTAGRSHRRRRQKPMNIPMHMLQHFSVQHTPVQWIMRGGR
jgi:hypothetical protein